jgi:hypothetical protein
MGRAALLHAPTYEEIEADRSALRQATAIVLGVAAAAALGTWLRTVLGHPLPARQLALQLVIVALEPLVVWLGSSAFAYMVGATFLRGPETETDYPEVLRTVGFAFAPGLLLVVLGLVAPPNLHRGIHLFVRLWIAACTIVAVRQACDFNTLRALGTFGAASFLLWILLWGIAVAPELIPGIALLLGAS